jgi:hypothetical protein
MFKCCICRKEMTTPKLWVCGECFRKFDLSLSKESWPEWAQSELRREQKRRSFEPSFGVSSSELRYAPYRRIKENKTYRKSNRVRKNAKPTPVRVNADDVFYSGGDGSGGKDDSGYDRVLEHLPVKLRERLLHHVEAQVIVADAIRSLPLISQRAIKGFVGGASEGEIARAEGVSETTMRWLIRSARERLHDILADKVGADDGSRYA